MKTSTREILKSLATETLLLVVFGPLYLPMSMLRAWMGRS